MNPQQEKILEILRVAPSTQNYLCKLLNKSWDDIKEDVGLLRGRGLVEWNSTIRNPYQEDGLTETARVLRIKKQTMKTTSFLEHGLIPRNTVCPFAEKCGVKLMGKCGHKGTEHPVDFSCGLARLFDITEKREHAAKHWGTIEQN